MNPLMGDPIGNAMAIENLHRQAGNALNPGWEVPGNIDLDARPVVKNPDGTISTVRSMSINVDGLEYLIPTVSDDGRVMTDDEAVRTFVRTGRHLGAFRSVDEADAYAQRLHERQAEQYR